MSPENYSQPSEADDSDMVSVTVHLTIYDLPNANNESPAHRSAEAQSSTVDVETFILKGGTVGDLKAVLESQDLIPDNMDEFVLDVRLSAQSSCSKDTEVIPESTKTLFLTLRPKVLPSSAVSTSSQASPTPLTSSLLNSAPLPLSLLTRLQNVQSAPNTTVSHSAAPSRSFPLFNPFEATGDTCQDDAADSLFSDSAMLQNIMNSPMMRSLFSNPDILRSILDANPQIRQLREQHPELNHLLNDPELLQQSIQAIQNPGLMQEMISNTDRVLNNIDAIPGGFNALRRVYQSIQEPIWDVAMGRGPLSQEPESRPRQYNLHATNGPSTEAIPNPWAPRRPKTGNSQAPSPSAARFPDSRTSLRHRASAAASFQTQRPQTAFNSAHPVASARLGSSATRTTPAMSIPPLCSSSQQSTARTASLSGSQDIASSSSVQPSQLSNVTKSTLVNAPLPCHDTGLAGGEVVESALTDAPSISTSAQQTTQICAPCYKPSSAKDSSDTEVFEKESTSVDPSTTPQNSDAPTSASVAPPSLTSLPFLFQNIFPHPQPLRSLGGLTLPPHIQGVVSPPPRDDAHAPDEDHADEPPSSNSSTQHWKGK